MEPVAHKLILAGPVGAGKTTAIRSLADSAPISTEMPLSEGAMGDKTTTTVALDFATIALDDGTPLFIYGLPGQERFAFMRPILLAGAVGVIILLDGAAATVATECEHWLRAIRAIDGGMPMVVGVTHTDHARGFNLSEVRAAIRRAGPPVPVFTVDARDREQTAHLVRAMLLAAM